VSWSTTPPRYTHERQEGTNLDTQPDDAGELMQRQAQLVELLLPPDRNAMLRTLLLRQIPSSARERRQL
jgi:hypothetical protein